MRTLRPALGLPCIPGCVHNPGYSFYDDENSESRREHVVRRTGRVHFSPQACQLTPLLQSTRRSFPFSPVHLLKYGPLLRGSLPHQPLVRALISLDHALADRLQSLDEQP